MRHTQSDPASKPIGTRGLTIAWLLLLTFSLANFYLAEGLLEGKQLALVIFAASFVKLTMIAGSFMELWSHGRPYFYIATGLFAITLSLMAFVW